MKNRLLKLHDLFLNQARKVKKAVLIYLVNGLKVKVSVKGFDSYVILLEGEDKKQSLIYKHAVSTVQPVDNISIIY